MHNMLSSICVWWNDKRPKDGTSGRELDCCDAGS